MASILSAGTTTATSLNFTADTSGVLQLASNNGTTAVTIGTNGNVGIGTSSPNFVLDVSLPVSTTGTVARFNSPSYEGVYILAGLNNGIGTQSTSNFGIYTNSTGRLSVNNSTGNLQFLTSNAGIQFNNSSATTNSTLNDYETGSWTPVWSGSGSGSGTPGGSTGTYTKIGRSVTITVSVNNSTPFITFSGNLLCSLPFTCGGGGQTFIGAPIYFYQGSQWNVGSTTAGITPVCSTGTSYMLFNVMFVNGDRQTQISNGNTSLSGGNNVYARFSMTYDASF
jgi:hypothetical protein